MEEKIVVYKDFRYKLLNDTEVELIDARGAKGEVVIPETIIAGGNTYTVTCIGNEMLPILFYDEVKDKRIKTGYRIENIRKKERPIGPFNQVERSGFNAYPGTYRYVRRTQGYSITEIILPKTIKRIKEGAFYGLWRPSKGDDVETKIVLPEGVETIEGSICYDPEIKELHIPSTVKKVPEFVVWPASWSGEFQQEWREKGRYPYPKVWFDNNWYWNINRVIIIHNDEGYVDVNPVNLPIKYVGKPKKTATASEKKTAKAETPKAASKPAKTETKAEPAKAAPKPAKTEALKPAATPAARAKGGLTVGSLTEAFKKQFGAVLRIYNGRSKADDGMSLQEVGLTQEIDTTFDGKQTVGAFIEQMAKAGLKVKVYTCDEWVAVLDGLTLESAGKVKKNATKADMEKML